MDIENIEILSNEKIPEEIRQVIAQAIVTQGTSREQLGLDREKLALEQKKFWLNTPIVAAIAGFLTLGATHVFDRWQGQQETSNTVTLEELRNEFSQSEARQKSKLNVSEARSVAEIEAVAQERKFQYEIVKAQLTNPELDNRERAKVLLFLTRAGVFSTLNESELREMAEAQIRDPNIVTVPLLTTSGPIAGDIEALQQLAYYPQEIDELLKSRYYSDFIKEIPEFDSLNQLVTRTHLTQFSYSEARLEHLYPNLERQLDARLLSLYGRDELVGFEFSQGFTKSEADRPQENTSNIPYNTEHVIPQSWFNKRQPMKSDMHHLFAENSNCNSFRSLHRFGSIDRTSDDTKKYVRSKCGIRTDEIFEPEAGKGILARAVLYFLARYPGEVGDHVRENGPEDLELFLEWHRMSPPTAYERRRNFLIQLLQGNRNPFIDYPELASKIDFSKGFGR